MRIFSLRQFSLKTFFSGTVAAAAIIGGTWAVIQMFDRFFPNGPQLIAAGRYRGPFAFPDSLMDQIRKNEKPIALTDIEGLLPEKLDNKSQLASKIAEFVNKDKPAQGGGSLRKIARVNALWVINIQNTGTREANSITLELPFDGYYALGRDNETQSSFDTFSHRITIGDLRPSDSVVILVWSTMNILNTFVGLYAPDDIEAQSRLIKVTYPQGVISVNFPIQLKGWSAFAYEWFWLLALAGLTGLLALKFLWDGFRKKLSPMISGPSNTHEDKKVGKKLRRL